MTGPRASNYAELKRTFERALAAAVVAGPLAGCAGAPALSRGEVAPSFTAATHAPHPAKEASKHIAREAPSVHTPSVAEDCSFPTFTSKMYAGMAVGGTALETASHVTPLLGGIQGGIVTGVQVGRAVWHREFVKAAVSLVGGATNTVVSTFFSGLAGDAAEEVERKAFDMVGLPSPPRTILGDATAKVVCKVEQMIKTHGTSVSAVAERKPSASPDAKAKVSDSRKPSKTRAPLIS